MLNKKLTAAAPALILALSANVFAWNSISTAPPLVGSSTHSKIAKEALKRMDFGVYPDMKTSARLIRLGSSSEAGHEKIHNGGGKLQDWWTGADGRETLRGGVMPNYTKLKIEDAYMNIGRMCHLTQDQAVPAHASRVQHSIVFNLPSDGMEKYAGYHPDFGPIPQVNSDKMPWEYYLDLQRETRSHLQEWKDPRTQTPYWIQSEEGSRMEDVTLGPIGHYGGGADAYRKNVFAEDKSAVALCARQLGMAAGYTKALVESASRLLPPLVSELAVYPNVVTPGRAVKIVFNAFENRTSHVKYAVLLKDQAGRELTVSEGDLKLYKPSPNPDDNEPNAQAKPEGSLFNRHVSIKWNALVDGRALPEGSYTVEVMLTDDDGNTVPASVNTDDIRENNTRTMLSVVRTEPARPDPFSFD